MPYQQKKQFKKKSNRKPSKPYKGHGSNKINKTEPEPTFRLDQMEKGEYYVFSNRRGFYRVFQFLELKEVRNKMQLLCKYGDEEFTIPLGHAKRKCTEEEYKQSLAIDTTYNQKKTEIHRIQKELEQMNKQRELIFKRG